MSSPTDVRLRIVAAMSLLKQDGTSEDVMALLDGVQVELADGESRLRDALLEVRSARGSLAFAAPETVGLHLARIDEALRDVADLLADTEGGG